MHHSGAHHHEGLVPFGSGVAQHTGSILLRSFWKPKESRWSTQDALATVVKEENLRSAGNCSGMGQEGIALPLPRVECGRVSGADSAGLAKHAH